MNDDVQWLVNPWRRIEDALYRVGTQLYEIGEEDSEFAAKVEELRKKAQDKIEIVALDPTTPEKVRKMMEERNE